MESGELDQNLVASSHKREYSPPPESAVEDPPRPRSFFLTLVYAVIAIASFSFFLLLKLPQDSIINGLLDYLGGQMPYAIHADKGEFRPLVRPHLHFEKLSLTPRLGAPTGPILLDSLDIMPNIMNSIPWTGQFHPSMDFAIVGFGGSADGSFGMGNSINFSVTARSLPIEKILQNLNMKGLLASLNLKADLPQGRYNHANGSLSISGKNLSFDPAALSLPIPIPLLHLGPLTAQAQLVDGKLQITKLNIGDSAHDLEALVDGTINLRDPLDYSDLDLKIRFKIGEALAKAVPGLDSMLPAFAAKRADGYYGIKLNGPMTSLGMPTPYP